MTSWTIPLSYTSSLPSTHIYPHLIQVLKYLVYYYTLHSCLLYYKDYSSLALALIHYLSHRDPLPPLPHQQHLPPMILPTTPPSTQNHGQDPNSKWYSSSVKIYKCQKEKSLLNALMLYWLIINSLQTSIRMWVDYSIIDYLDLLYNNNNNNVY